MAATTITTFSGLMKRRYTSEKITQLMASGADNPFYASINKDDTVTGESFQVPFVATNPQGVAMLSLAKARSNATGSRTHQLTVVPSEIYAVHSLSDRVLKLGAGGDASWLTARTAELDRLGETYGEVMARHCLQSAGGQSLGQAADVQATYFILSELSQVEAFEVGMILVASSGAGTYGGATGKRTGSVTVTAVDRSAGKVYCTTSGITSFTNNDYVFRDGDFGEDLTYPFWGFPGWITATESPAAIYGVTRTAEPQRLAGCRVPSTAITGLDIEQRLQLLGAYMAGRYKSKAPRDIWLHPEDWQTLSTVLQSRGQRTLGGTAEGGYETLRLAVGGRVANVHSVAHVVKGTAYVGDPSDWTLYMSNGAGKLEEGPDGLILLRHATDAEYEIRIIGYPALVCYNPARQGRVSLA